MLATTRELFSPATNTSWHFRNSLVKIRAEWTEGRRGGATYTDTYLTKSSASPQTSRP